MWRPQLPREVISVMADAIRVNPRISLTQDGEEFGLVIRSSTGRPLIRVRSMADGSWRAEEWL